MKNEKRSHQKYVFAFGLAAFIAALGMFGSGVALAAPLTFATTTVTLTSPAVNFTIASSSTADALTVNATSVVVSLSASGGNSFTLTSSQSDIDVSVNGTGGPSSIQTCSGTPGSQNALPETVLTQTSNSAIYTITPSHNGCLFTPNPGGGISIYPLAITAAGSLSTTLGTPLTVQLSVSDPNGYTPTLSVSTLPSGASFSSSTNILTWTPQAVGTTTVTFLATDAVTQTTSSMMLTALAQGAAPISGGGGGSGSGGGNTGISLTPSASSSTADLTALLHSLQAELNLLIQEAQAQGIALPSGVGSTASSLPFNQNLAMGAQGDEVNRLQQFLITAAKGAAAHALAVHGATNYFGQLTFKALTEYQRTVGITPTSGFFGPKTRAFINAILSH
jgi:hypothetical protein